MTTIERFTAEYHPFHSISPARATEQRNLLLHFESFAGIPIEQTDETHLRAYLSKLVADGFHPNTVRKKRSMLLPFYGWCFDARLVSAEVLMRVQRVKNPRGATSTSLPKPYTQKERQAFWADLDATWPRATDERMRRWRRGNARYRRVATHFMHAQINAVTHLALHAGLRRDEIFNAGLADLHYDNAYVVVRHAARKNLQAVAKPREVPMTVDLSKALQEWLDLRDELLLTVPKRARHDFPWLSLAANQPKDTWVHPMSHDRFEELLATVGGGYRLHRFRHTCGTEWLRDHRGGGGLPIEQVKELLGHAKLQQTLAYAEILKTDLEKGMGKVAADFQTAVGRAA